jgi:beta-lactamase class C
MTQNFASWRLIRARIGAIEPSQIIMPQMQYRYCFAPLLLIAVIALSIRPAASEPSIVRPPPVTAPTLPGDRPEQLHAAIEQAERLARNLAANGSVPAIAFAVVKNGEVLTQQAYGVLDASGAQPASTHTVFRLASMSKAFAATLAGLLVDDGYLRWDDRVQDLVPVFALINERATGKLTLEQVLSHRVGLPRNAEDSMLERDEPYPILLYKLRDVPMACDVGECYGYQNVAFGLMADVTFAATGDFYSHQVEARIFHPLNMDTATYGRAALEASAEWARPHVRTFRGWHAVPVRDNYYRVPPAAGVNASISDVTQWLLAHLGHRPEVLSPELLTTLHTARVVTPGEGATSPWRRERVRRAQYALGWRVYDYAGENLVFHAGAVQGYRGMIGMLPSHDFGVAILWNCESSAPSGLMPTLLDAYLGLPARQWVAAADDSDDSHAPTRVRTAAPEKSVVKTKHKGTRRGRRA